MKENGPPATRIAPGPRAVEALQSWAIHRASSPIEQMLWSKRGVEIFDVDLDEFAANLSHRAAIGHVCESCDATEASVAAAVAVHDKSLLSDFI
jgi:hypothetical protein